MSLPASRIHKRADWDTRNPKGPPMILQRSAVKILAYHYSSMDAERRADHAQCAGVVRNIQRFHQDARGWNDVAYNWLVCHHGHVYEGRGWDVMSAATFGVNDRSQAVCFLGGDVKNRDDVTVPGREALADRANDALARYGVDLHIGGHREYVSTSCPGEEITAWIAAEGWEVDKPAERPWPIPVPAWFWQWARWQRERFKYATRAKWMHARPASAPARVPDWAWVRLAAMTPKAGL